MGAVMTQVVKVDFKGPQSVASLTALDALSTEAQSVVDVRGRIRKIRESEPHTLEDADKRIVESRGLKPSEQDLTELAIQMENGLRRATSEQMQEQLGMLNEVLVGRAKRDRGRYGVFRTEAHPSVAAFDR
jgi:hypothetical protein